MVFYDSLTPTWCYLGTEANTHRGYTSAAPPHCYVQWVRTKEAARGCCLLPAPQEHVESGQGGNAMAAEFSIASLTDAMDFVASEQLSDGGLRPACVRLSRRGKRRALLTRPLSTFLVRSMRAIHVTVRPCYPPPRLFHPD